MAYLSHDIRASTAGQPYDSADDTRQEQDADRDVKSEFDSRSGVEAIEGEKGLQPEGERCLLHFLAWSGRVEGRKSGRVEKD